MIAKTAIAAGTFALLAGSASADISMRFIEKAAGRNVEVELNGNAADYFAGQLLHDIDNSSNPTQAVDGQVISFCVEIEQQTSGNYHTFQVSTLDDQIIPAAIGASGNARTQAVLDVAAAHYLLASSTGASNDEAAAFQMLLWEIIYDYNPAVGLSSIDPTSGNLRLRRTNGDPLWANVSSLISNYANAIGDNSQSRAFSLLTSPSKQDQIIPSPGAIALFGGAALAGFRRRR